jgi:hypothetical protein
MNICQQLRILDDRIQLDAHVELWGTKDQHFHLEIDDGTI